MASDLNRMEVTGRTGQDPSLNYTGGGTPVCNISVAVNDEWRDRQSGEKQERTEWFRVVFWGRAAETVAKYLGKGSSLYVAGPMTSNPFTDKNGIYREGWQIRAQDFRFFDVREPAGQPQQEQSEPEPASMADDPDEDIPF